MSWVRLCSSANIRQPWVTQTRRFMSCNSASLHKKREPYRANLSDGYQGTQSVPNTGTVGSCAQCPRDRPPHPHPYTPAWGWLLRAGAWPWLGVTMVPKAALLTWSQLDVQCSPDEGHQRGCEVDGHVLIGDGHVHANQTLGTRGRSEPGHCPPTPTRTTVLEAGLSSGAGLCRCRDRRDLPTLIPTPGPLHM